MKEIKTVHTERKNKPRLYRLTSIALASVIMAICSWITVPGVIPFTLQTMGLFLTLGLLGGLDGTIAVAVYILLGIIGVPVFSGFGSGIGHILGATGGYIVGFIFSGLLYMLLSAIRTPDKMWLKMLYMLGGAVAYFAFGTLWFSFIWSGASGDVVSALSKCVLPFIIPDLIKLIIAGVISDRVCRALEKSGLSRG